MRRRIAGRRILVAAILVAIAVVGGNLLWLATSTLRIENASREKVEAVAFSACDRIHEVGSLVPGESAFRLLPSCGDDTLEILLGDSRLCRIYVEGELYHVDAAIRARDRVDCAYDHLLASLLVGKLF